MSFVGLGGGVVTVLAIVLGMVVYVLARVAAGLISKEAAGWAPHVSLSIVRRASRRLPKEHRARWLEEMEADIGEFGDRPLSGLSHAMLAARGARRLARELGPAVVANAGDGGEPQVPRVTLRDRRVKAASILGLSARLERRLARLEQVSRILDPVTRGLVEELTRALEPMFLALDQMTRVFGRSTRALARRHWR